MKRSGDPADYMIPTDGCDVIPAFSLVEVTLASKNSDSAEGKGSCVNILKVRRLPDDVSLHSIAGILDRMPKSLNDALMFASDKATSSPYIASDLVKDNVAFFKATCNKDTTCSVVDVVNKAGVSNTFVRLNGWSQSPSDNINTVDISAASLMRLSNCKRLEHAVALLQTSFAFDGAVSLLIAHDPFLAKAGQVPPINPIHTQPLSNAVPEPGGSCLHGVAIINASKVLKTIQFNTDGEYDTKSKTISVDTGAVYDDEEAGETQSISFDIALEAKVSSEEDTVPSPDFPMSIGYTTSKAYAVVASLASAPPDKEPVNGILQFNVDVSRRSAQSSVGRSSAGNVKRKLSSMQWS